jgi:glycosyltransferase involved in cell wall biosynthesis
VVTLSHPGTVADALRADGVTVHELTMRGNRDVSVIRDLRRLIRARGADLVHTHLYRACVYGRIAARLARVPAVATEHSIGDGVIEGRRATVGVRMLYRATERLGAATVAVSGTVAARLRAWGVPAKRIVVIPNGIDADELTFDPVLRKQARVRLGIAEEAVVVGAVGRLEQSKRFDRLVAALPAVPGATLLLAGDGSQRERLAEAATQAGVADRVVFAGAVPHPREVLCAMDVFASPSNQETFGLAVLEALANGLPAVYATCPPLDEHAAASGVRGNVTVPGAWRLSHDREALPRALRAELASLGLRDGSRLPVPAVVSRFDTARLAASTSDLYERVKGP